MPSEKIKQKFVIRERKSVVLSSILTLFFGPLGLFYLSTGLGIAAVLFTIGFGLITFGIGAFLCWPASIILGIILPIIHRKKVTVRIETER